MRATFYVAALLGLVGFQSVAAVNIQPQDDFDFAQTDAMCECEGEGEGKVETKTETKTTGLTAADCFQEMNGVVIRLATPGCEAVPAPKPCPPKPCFEQEMLNALQELGAKSNML